jgi:hypothetical protein
MSSTMTFASFEELAAYMRAQQPDAEDFDSPSSASQVAAAVAGLPADVPQPPEYHAARDPESTDAEGGAVRTVEDPVCTPAAGGGADQLAWSGDTAETLPGLLARLESAGLTLGRIVRQDAEARTLALRDLERHDALVAAAQEAEEAHRRAERVRAEAETVAANAFAPETHDTAREVLALASEAAAAAGRLAHERRAEAAVLAGRLDLERLLAERRRQEEAEKARAAAAVRAGRLSGALSRAREALEAGRLEEAKDLLGVAANLDPESSAVSSLRNIIAQREFAVKATAAEKALWAARRELRHRHADAIARLEALDVARLPDDLAREVFGEWARAWSRQCRAVGIDEPLRYAPEPSRGAVLARDTAGGPQGHYKVLGAIGMGPQWRPGSAVGEAQVRRARPLR